ncbi:prepilin-type N-terminal cleavage/methylation domain-containing protein [Dokdonella sp.]|uniref:prepilin-type N-terminal cleavage/methylation domain-containing protein n=1 Tax=Dokdonella sp. TaxID=2291710 RepID=UPI0031C72F90|nr:prepilin-type N-terminal cleavage/methylation domain-containing protein [Dokdonella sp.]
MKFQTPGAPAANRGFTLLEVMIALTLGLLLSAGILTVFSGTSRTNKIQDGLARLQENGRFAIMRMTQDLRMTGAQYCSNNTGASAPGAVVPVLAGRAPMVYAKNIALPDSTFKSIDGAGLPSADDATAPYGLSPRWFMQGYSCGASTCTPTLSTATGIPDMGVAAGKRVKGSDVLTIRYQRGTGWPLAIGSCSVAGANPLAAGTTFNLNPQSGDDPIGNMQPGRALISDCINPTVIPISGVSGNTLTVGDILPGATGIVCSGSRLHDVRLFNFDTDFVTVSYYLALREDDNPDARRNSSAAKRLIPVLIRRENGVEQELVRGVDQLMFRYAVQDATGNTRIMTASEVQAGTACPPPPPGLNVEPGCLWRSVRAIEPHLLVNTVDDIASMDASSRSYRFDGTLVTKGETDLLPSGLQAGNQPRREFIAYISNHSVNL